MKPEDFAKPLVLLKDAFNRGVGVRLGESTVASRKVHFLDPSKPGTVKIGVSSDAGRVFYGRSDEGAIVHLDIFHQVAELDHRSIAKAILLVLAGMSHEYSVPFQDYVDLQTGVGGGRLSGQLIYGTKPSLRKAHLNHVHFALMLSDAELWVLFEIVEATEQEILRQGAEIRKVERIINDTSVSSDSLDLSPYRSPGDSFLKDEGCNGDADRIIQEQIRLHAAVSIADHFGSIRDVEEILDAIGDDAKMQSLATSLAHRKQSLLEAMEALASRGLITKQGHKSMLTAEGKRLRRFFAESRSDIEAEFRRLLRRIPAMRTPTDKLGHYGGGGQKGKLLRRYARTPKKGEWLSNIALSESAISACVRSYREGRHRISFSNNDIRVYETWGKKSVDICLLIDSSASMAGRRIKAAKYLVRHLLLSTSEKVAVVVFQEADSTVFVPFTRNYHRVEEGLAQIQPFGLTPLADGIQFTLDFIKRSMVKNPLLLLITDGIPTVPKWTLNPLEDALTASDYVSFNRVRFACIGLQPNRLFLQELARKAKGTLYVIDEIEEGTLISIAHQERGKFLRSGQHLSPP